MQGSLVVGGLGRTDWQALWRVCGRLSGMLHGSTHRMNGLGGLTTYGVGGIADCLCGSISGVLYLQGRWGAGRREGR